MRHIVYLAIAVITASCSSQPSGQNRRATSAKQGLPSSEADALKKKRILKDQEEGKEVEGEVLGTQQSETGDPIDTTNTIEDGMASTTQENGNTTPLPSSKNQMVSIPVKETHNPSKMNAAGFFEGILDCPTVDAPPLTLGNLEQNAALSETSKLYAANCLACHGAQGKGMPGYPAIDGSAAISKADFINAVRNGVGKSMPSFGNTDLSDAEINSMYDDLKSGNIRSAANSDIATAKVQSLRSKGLELWRKPDPKGAACANCHSPDAIDLAIIGFDDGAILRRAQQHLSPKDSQDIVKFVHAQRAHFKIARPCSPKWRPFQPGGKVLPGSTPAEMDASLGAALEAKNLMLVSGRVVTLADAQKAAKEFMDLNIRNVPTSVAMPRWTEDKFNGTDHSDYNDYMTPVAHIPKSANAWYGMQDAYIANPSDENLAKMIDDFDDQTSMEHFLSGRGENISNARNPFLGDSTSYVRLTGKAKTKALLVAQHLFRKELLDLPGKWFDNDGFASDGSFVDHNPFFRFGAMHIEPPSYTSEESSPKFFKTFPEEMRSEIKRINTNITAIQDFTDRLSHPWMTLGQLADPATTDFKRHGGGNVMFYWSNLHFTQKQIGEPFYYAHRLMQRYALYVAANNGSALGERLKRTRSVEIPAVNPLLDGYSFFQRKVSEPITDPELFRFNRFKGNLIRMIVLLQKEELRKGEATKDAGELKKTLTNSGDFHIGFKRLANYMASLNKNDAKVKSLAEDLDLYGNDLKRLIDEVAAEM